MARNRNRTKRSKQITVAADLARRAWIDEHGGIARHRSGGAAMWVQRNGRALASKKACRQPITDY